MASPVRLKVEVFKPVRVTAPATFVRGVLVRAGTLTEVEARLPAGTCSIAVKLTGDDELRRLNLVYAGHDAVTDVLSFPAAPGGGGTPATADEHVGDLAISWPMVVRQAQEFGHPELTELGLLCVHGLLHLLGWDHESAKERREMSRLTIAALALSGLSLAPGRL